jgi:hypothetical protein
MLKDIENRSSCRRSAFLSLTPSPSARVDANRIRGTGKSWWGWSVSRTDKREDVTHVLWRTDSSAQLIQPLSLSLSLSLTSDAVGGARTTDRTSPVQSLSAARTDLGRIPPIHFLRERLSAFRASPAINLPPRQNPAPYEEYGRHRRSHAGQEKIPREKEHREEDTYQRKGSNDRESVVCQNDPATVLGTNLVLLHLERPH